MNQRYPHQPTVDELGLSAWAATVSGAPADLGSLSGALGEFLPAPPPPFDMPAQRSSILLEVLG